MCVFVCVSAKRFVHDSDHNFCPIILKFGTWVRNVIVKTPFGGQVPRVNSPPFIPQKPLFGENLLLKPMDSVTAYILTTTKAIIAKLDQHIKQIELKLNWIWFTVHLPSTNETAYTITWRWVTTKRAAVACDNGLLLWLWLWPVLCYYGIQRTTDTYTLATAVTPHHFYVFSLLSDPDFTNYRYAKNYTLSYRSHLWQDHLTQISVGLHKWVHRHCQWHSHGWNVRVTKKTTREVKS